MNNLFEVLLILLLTVLNGVFSMSETAIVSVRRARLQQRADAGDPAAKVALELVRQPDRFLSTVQIGITLIGIVAGAFGGASLSEDVGLWLTGLGLAPEAARSVAFFLVVALITYLSLVVGELVPKTLALNNAERIAVRVARPMNLLSRFASPMVWLLALSTNGLLRLMGVKQSGEPPVTEDEINILIGQGVKVGVFAEEEQAIVERVFRTADRRVSQLMTPRREVVFLDVEDSWEENRARIAATPHSAFPVCEGSPDKVIGVIVLKRLWNARDNDSGTIDLRALVEEPMFVLETTHALSMLERFRSAKGRHIAMVVDEYGIIVGLVTLHDVLEGIVGEMPSAEEVRGQDLGAVRRDDGSWLLDGMLAADEMRHLLGIKAEPKDAGNYNTLGGFVMARLGHIPGTGERFEWEGVVFEVLDMDGHRVDRVLATPPNSRGTGPESASHKQPGT
ncbi:MAG: hemolysin family protein [Capsulimonadales bacterium]|nr:hemolysin family protein [Capsulimonadales bacterium]